MKRITKKLCSAVCALLAFSGSRGGALTKEALHLTKEILCNAVQWYTCYEGYSEYNIIFHVEDKQGKLVPDPNLTFGQKACGYAIGATTIANAVDAAKRSYDIGCDIIKGSKNKPNTKKDSKNYWPILEAIFGISQFAYAFGHRPILDTDCEGVCIAGLTSFVVSLILFTDAYFRFRGNNQNSRSPIQNKEEAT